MTNGNNTDAEDGDETCGNGRGGPYAINRVRHDSRPAGPRGQNTSQGLHMMHKIHNEFMHTLNRVCTSAYTTYELVLYY